jgi:steroid delta-isomerase-like uncharacterized protein
MPAAENRRIARQFFDDVFNKGNLETVDQIFASEYVGHSSANLNRPIKGPAGIKRFVAMYRKAFPDIRFTFDDIISRGDKIVVRWTTEGTHRGELFGIAPTGKRMGVTGIGIAQIVGGRIRVSHSQVDMLGLTQQLGLVPEIEQR